MELIKVKPHFVKKIWGGTISEQWYNHVSKDVPIGEIWSVCANKNISNQLEETTYLLDKWLMSHPAAYPMKPQALPFRVSIIDAKDDLSIQVHPTKKYAKQYGLKTGLDEAWIILDADEDAAIQIGHTATSKLQLSEMVVARRFEELLLYEGVERYDAFYISAGTIHAIGAHTLVYEISQAQEQTFRVYDYQRIDQTTNKMRELHIEQALEVITIPDQFSNKLTEKWVTYPTYDYRHVVSCDHFRLDQYSMRLSGEIKLASWGFLTIVEGQGKVGHLDVCVGDTILVPMDHRTTRVEGKLTMIYASIGEKHER